MTAAKVRRIGGPTVETEVAVNSNDVGRELREQVARVLGVDPKELAPRR